MIESSIEWVSALHKSGLLGPKRHCACGRPILLAKSLVCFECAKNNRKILKTCSECGKQLGDYRAKRCASCFGRSRRKENRKDQDERS